MEHIVVYGILGLTSLGWIIMLAGIGSVQANCGRDALDRGADAGYLGPAECNTIFGYTWWIVSGVSMLVGAECARLPLAQKVTPASAAQPAPASPAHALAPGVATAGGFAGHHLLDCQGCRALEGACLGLLGDRLGPDDGHCQHVHLLQQHAREQP